MSKIKQSDNEFPATHWTRIKDKDGDKPQWVIHIYFPTSRQMNRTLKRDKVTSKRLCAHIHTHKHNSPYTHTLCTHVQLFLPPRQKRHTSRAFYYQAREPRVLLHKNRFQLFSSGALLHQSKRILHKCSTRNKMQHSENGSGVGGEMWMRIDDWQHCEGSI